MHSNCCSPIHRLKYPLGRGFTLVELSVALVILGLIAVLMLELIPKLSDRTRLDQTEVDIENVDETINGFALANNRLPCPDTNDDGFEGGAGGCVATDEVGALPFRTLGLPGPALDRARLPLRYGVYRNPGASADLVTLTELFEPALPDALTITAGTVSGCNQTLANPVVRIAYSMPPSTILRLSGVTGTFKGIVGTDPTDAGYEPGEFIGFVNLGYNSLTTVVPPAPASPVWWISGTPGTPPGVVVNNCPCGFTISNPDLTDAVCNTCTGFSLANLITADTSDDSPILTNLKTVTATNLIGYPGGPFTVGDTISELFTAPFPGAPPLDFERTITSGVTDNLLTGVSATVTSVVSRSAHVISVTDLGGGIVELEIDQLPIVTTPGPTLGDPNPFLAGETVYGGLSNASGTVVSQITIVQIPFNDITPESITASSGGTGTIDVNSDSGRSFTISGGVTGTIAVGDTITGNSSTATGTVVSVSSDSTSTPVTAPGSIAFTPTLSAQTNELDFCQGLRNGITAAGDTGSASFVNTVNPGAVAINPAYLLVSGGVEDANGNAADGSFDLRNEIMPALRDFESPARLRNDASAIATVYDDVVETASMQTLSYRLSCARNLAAVNALAVDATVMRNAAEVSFDLNEQALGLVEVSFRVLELAKVNRDIAAVQIVLEAVSIAIDIYALIKDPEGFVATGVIIAADLASLAAVIGDLAAAIVAVTAAEGTYASACTSQVVTESNLNNAIPAATTALELGLRGDAWGGVQ